MFGVILRDTRKSWGLLGLLLVVFLLVSAYGVRRIYNAEKQAMRDEAEVKLRAAETILRGAFMGWREDVRFLRGRPVVADFVASGFSDGRKRLAIQELFFSTLLAHGGYRRLVLIDGAGKELARVDNPKEGPPVIARGMAVRPRVYQSCLAGTRQLPAGRTRAVSTLAGEDGKDARGEEQELFLSTGLFDKKGAWRGALTLSLGLEKVLALLPQGVFFRTGNNSVFSGSRASGNPPFSSSLRFAGDKGVIPVSGAQTIHFVKVGFLPGQKLVIALSQDTGAPGGAFFRVTLLFLGILGGFFALLAVLSHIRTNQLKELIEAQRAIVFSLANLAEWRDHDTGQHLERTRNFGSLLARELRKNKKYSGAITDSFLADLYDAAPLHDLGKVGVADSILLKPGALTAEEYELMQRHVIIGKDILQSVIGKLRRPKSFLVMSRNIAHFHHEKYDGSGYPRQLDGAEIPLEARIYGLCDAYDAIRSRRPYKGPLTHPQAVQIIFADRGMHFDPDVVNAFLDCETEFMEIYEAYMLYDDVFRLVFKERTMDDVAIVWSDDFKVGIDLVDAQHRELIGRINSLFQCILQGKGKEETLRLIRFLQGYVVEHFSTEEQYMKQHNYSDYAQHKAMHVQFTKDLAEIVSQVEREGVSSDLVVMVYKKVAAWLVSHIFLVDKGVATACGQSAA